MGNPNDDTDQLADKGGNTDNSQESGSQTPGAEPGSNPESSSDGDK